MGSFLELKNVHSCWSAAHRGLDRYCNSRVSRHFSSQFLWPNDVEQKIVLRKGTRQYSGFVGNTFVKVVEWGNVQVATAPLNSDKYQGQPWQRLYTKTRLEKKFWTLTRFFPASVMCQTKADWNGISIRSSSCGSNWTTSLHGRNSGNEFRCSPLFFKGLVGWVSFLFVTCVDFCYDKVFHKTENKFHDFNETLNFF